MMARYRTKNVFACQLIAFRRLVDVSVNCEANLCIMVDLWDSSGTFLWYIEVIKLEDFVLRSRRCA